MSTTCSATHATFDGIAIIDVDTHLTEPGDLWTALAPATWKHRVPRIVPADGLAFQNAFGEKVEGTQFMWVVDDDVVLGQAGAGSVINRDYEKVRGSSFMRWPIDEASPAASFLEPRLHLMDELGIWAQIVYPNVVGLGGERFSMVKDDELRLVCVQIWNDAMAELSRRSGGRLNPMALFPWWDVRAAVTEIERAHELGLKGVNTTSDPQVAGVPDLADGYWEPLWDVCEGLGLPVNFHIGSSQTQRSWFGNAPWPSLDNDRKLALGSTMLFLANSRVIGNLLFSGVLERHPELKFVSVESGVGWVPWLLETLDYQAVEADVHLPMKPSEYFHRQIYSCFWYENENVLDSIERLGYEKCMFETDFPHPTCLYPDPLAQIAPTLEQVGFDVRKKLLSENAANLYNICTPSAAPETLSCTP